MPDWTSALACRDDISGKAAVVTGGGSRVGMGLARELAKQGASVAIADIILEMPQKIAGAIQANPTGAVLRQPAG